MKRHKIANGKMAAQSSLSLLLPLLMVMLCGVVQVEAQRKPPVMAQGPSEAPTPQPFPDGVMGGGMPSVGNYRQDQQKAFPMPKMPNVTYYFVFAQLWPNGYCMAAIKDNCHQLPLHFPENMWTVRGLWVAMSKSSKHIRYCKSSAEAMKTPPTASLPQPQQKNPLLMQHHLSDQPHISSQMAIDLDRIWPPLEAGPVPANRWVQEYKTYGVCTGLGEDGYFGMILNLHQQFSMYNILASASVVPDDIYTYRASTLKNAIRKVHGFECELLCRRRRLSANGRFAYVNILQEIHFCFNVNLEPIDCPSRNSTINQINILHDRPFICAFDVLYPKFPSGVHDMKDKTVGQPQQVMNPPGPGPSPQVHYPAQTIAYPVAGAAGLPPVLDHQPVQGAAPQQVDSYIYVVNPGAAAPPSTGAGASVVQVSPDYGQQQHQQPPSRVSSGGIFDASPGYGPHGGGGG
eukprot:scpid87144/ scgid30827/ 